MIALRAMPASLLVTPPGLDSRVGCLDGGFHASGDVVDQGPARTTEPVVERDGGSQRQEALGDADAQVGESASAVALQGEDVLAGPEDRLHPLADRARWTGLSGSLFRAGRTIVAPRSATAAAKRRPA